MPEPDSTATSRKSPDGSSFADVMHADTPRGAELRSDWRSSRERKRISSAVALIAAGVLVTTVVGWEIGKATAPAWEDNQFRAQTLALISLAGGLYIGVFLFIFVRRQQRNAWYDRVVLLSARVALEEAEAEVGQEDLDLNSLWKLTQRRLDYYHKIATSQSERSFAYGVAAAAVGFLVLAGTAIGVGLAHSTTASVVAGIVGAGGSALAAYIGATFLRLQESSAKQLRAYFAQPLEFSRYLAAERLLGSLSEEARESATNVLIHALADSGSATPPPAP